jgi:probable HAF family extracellular repeat protein
MSAADDLGSLGGDYVLAAGVNVSGQAVGYSHLSGNWTAHAFRTAPSGMITSDSDLGTLGGVYSEAAAINASGQTVGFSSLLGEDVSHAFRTTATGKITAASDLGVLPGTVLSRAYGINSSGQVVGTSGARAFRTTAQGMIDATSDLGTLGGTAAYAYAINDAGQVVGQSYTVNEQWHAFRTAANGMITPDSDLGTLGGPTSDAHGINSLGQAVGRADTDVIINGSFYRSHAFIADPGGGIIDLNTLIPTDGGWELFDAVAINDAGQIAVNGGNVLGNVLGNRVLLLTPVPEPASVIAVLAAVVPHFLVARRRR